MYLGDVSPNVEPAPSWLTQITSAIPAIAQAYTQKKLIDVQVSRARAGLPPIAPTALQPAPFRVETSVGVERTTQRTMLIAGGAALVGLVALLALRK